MSPVRTTWTSLSRGAAIRLTFIYAFVIAACYGWLFSKRGTVAPEVFHDAIYNSLPPAIGGLLGCLIWVFWGEQIVAAKQRMRIRLAHSKFRFLAAELPGASKRAHETEKVEDIKRA